MKLMYSPGACSFGIHVLLEEVGKPYEAEAVNLRQPKPERPLTGVNPKSKVPTLIRDDGSVLTEYPAIAFWLAVSNPAAGLMPATVEAQTRALEATDFCVSTLHMLGFSPMFAAGRAATPELGEALKAGGRAVVENGLAHMSAVLGSQDYVLGSYSFADSALFYNTNWAGMFGVDLPANIAAFRERMRARPAVQRVIAAEGLS
jgi:glutathione S-transferase